MAQNDTPSSQELADTRTDWAEDRTILANERTFAAWMRTGMACIGVALGLRAVFGATDHPLAAKAVAEVFIACAILIFWAATKRCRAAQSRFESHDAVAISLRNITLTAAIMSFGAISVGIILWLL